MTWTLKMEIMRLKIVILSSVHQILSLILVAIASASILECFLPIDSSTLSHIKLSRLRIMIILLFGGSLNLRKIIANGSIILGKGLSKR